MQHYRLVIAILFSTSGMFAAAKDSPDKLASVAAIKNKHSTTYICNNGAVATTITYFPKTNEVVGSFTKNDADWHEDTDGFVSEGLNSMLEYSSTLQQTKQEYAALVKLCAEQEQAKKAKETTK